MNKKPKQMILIVDDNPANIEVLGGILNSEYDVSVATTGERAIEIAKSDNSPSLILLDIMMPIMDGYEVCRILKKHPTASKIPIILVSAKCEDKDETFGLELGVEDYIKKPVNPSIAMARIKTQLMVKKYRDQLENQLVESENAFQKQKTYFTQLFCNSPQAIVFIDYNGSVIDANQGFENLFGYSINDIKSSDATYLVIPDDKIDEHKTFYQSIVKGNRNSIETIREHKSGRSIPVSLFGYPVNFESEFEGIFLIYEDISQRKNFENQLRHQAFHDALTGTANRILLMERVERALSRQKRLHDFQFAVLLIDLDRFKAVNDSLGHQAGDSLLITVSQRIQSCIRTSDTIARLGGDEFAVLIEDFKDKDEVCTITQRIQNSIQDQVIINGCELHISASIGVVIDVNAYENAEDIFRNADLAMYSAKDDGRANYKFFDEKLYYQALESANIEKDLRHVLENNELELYYQPIVSLDTNMLTGFEALIRWNHPVQGLIPPDKFIPIAENTGLIIPIGNWILEEACRQLKEWQNILPQEIPITMNINLSVKQFLQDNLVEMVQLALSKPNLDPRSIKLELTESLLMDHSESALEKINQLKEMGIQFVIDDFGTGYSSLSYIHQFPVDVLKIDRSFVKNLDSGEECTEIIKTIISLSRNLGLTVVAEGIENQFQMNILKQVSCDNAQGYFFSKPMQKENVVSFMREMQKVSA